MAEEEAGFTFVDKRGVVEAEETEPAESFEETLAEDAFHADDAAQSGEVQDPPSVWALLHYSLQLFAQHAWVSMGLIANPATGQPHSDLGEARVAIDTVGDLVSRLESAPEGVIPSNARRDLRNLVNDLRLNYVNQKQAASPAETPA